jgi:hypothetical protein
LGDWAECCGKMTGRHLVTSALASTEFASLVHALAVHVTCLHSTLFEISFAICFAVRASLATLMHALANPRQHASRLVTHWPSTTLLCTATTRCTCFAVCFNLFTCDHWCCTCNNGLHCRRACPAAHTLSVSQRKATAATTCSTLVDKM